MIDSNVQLGLPLIYRAARRFLRGYVSKPSAMMVSTVIPYRSTGNGILIARSLEMVTYMKVSVVRYRHSYVC